MGACVQEFLKELIVEGDESLALTGSYATCQTELMWLYTRRGREILVGDGKWYAYGFMFFSNDQERTNFERAYVPCVIKATIRRIVELDHPLLEGDTTLAFYLSDFQFLLAQPSVPNQSVISTPVQLGLEYDVDDDDDDEAMYIECLQTDWQLGLAKHIPQELADYVEPPGRRRRNPRQVQRATPEPQNAPVERSASQARASTPTRNPGRQHGSQPGSQPDSQPIRTQNASVEGIVSPALTSPPTRNPEQSQHPDSQSTRTASTERSASPAGNPGHRSPEPQPTQTPNASADSALSSRASTSTGNSGQRRRPESRVQTQKTPSILVRPVPLWCDSVYLEGLSRGLNIAGSYVAELR